MNEVMNDGKTIHLYFNPEIGLYLAYGFSAYYITMVTEPYMSYSDELQMPVALLRHEHILYLRQSLTKIEHQIKRYYQFRMRTSIGEAGYDRWAQNLLKKQSSAKSR